MTGKASYSYRVIALVRAEWRTWANLVTAIRAVLSIAVLALILQRSDWAPWVYAFTASTDWVDGQLARGLHQETFLGKILDPMVDKWLILMASIGIINGYWDKDWFVIGFVTVIIVREAAVTILVDVFRRKELTLSVTWQGKFKTALQGAVYFVLIVLLSDYASAIPVSPFMRYVMIVVATVTGVSGADYFFRAKDMLRPVPDVEG